MSLSFLENVRTTHVHVLTHDYTLKWSVLKQSTTQSDLFSWADLQGLCQTNDRDDCNYATLRLASLRLWNRFVLHKPTLTPDSLCMRKHMCTLLVINSDGTQLISNSCSLCFRGHGFKKKWGAPGGIDSWKPIFSVLTSSARGHEQRTSLWGTMWT